MHQAKSREWVPSKRTKFTKRPGRYTDGPISETEESKAGAQDYHESQEPNGMTAARTPSNRRDGSAEDENLTEPTVDELIFRAASAFTNIVNTRNSEKQKQEKLKELLQETEKIEKDALDKTLSKGIGVLNTSTREPKGKPKVETSGSAWFDMPAPRLTPELKRELHVLSLRSHVDRARKYKKGSEIQSGKWPKFFQIATVETSPADRYSHARPTKKDRSKSIAQALLADAQQRKYRKEKFMEIQRSRSSRRDMHKQRKSSKPPKRERKHKGGNDAE